MATSGMDPALLQVEALLAEKNRSEKENTTANFLSELLSKMAIPENEKETLRSKLKTMVTPEPMETSQSDQVATQNWDIDENALSVQQVHRLAKKFQLDASLYMDKGHIKPKHVTGLKMDLTKQQIEALIANDTHKWTVCRSNIRASPEDEKRCLRYKDDGNISWFDTIETYNDFQCSRNYSDKAILEGLQDLAVQVYPTHAEYIREKSLKSLELYLKGFQVQKTDHQKYVAKLASCTRFPTQDFLPAYNEAVYIYKKYRGKTIKDLASPDTNNVNFDMGLYEFVFKCISAFCIPEVANKIIATRDKQIRLSQVVTAETFFHCIKMMEKDESCRPTQVKILGWKPQSIQINNVNLEKIKRNAKNFGIDPNLIQPQATNEIDYMHQLSVEDDQQNVYKGQPQRQPLLQNEDTFSTPTRGEIQPVVNLETIQSMQQMQNPFNVLQQKTTSRNAPIFTPPEFTQVLPLNEAIQALNSVNLPEKNVDRPTNYLHSVRKAIINEQPHAYRAILDDTIDAVAKIKINDTNQRDVIKDTIQHVTTKYPTLNPDIAQSLTVSNTLNEELGTDKNELISAMASAQPRQSRHISNNNINARDKSPGDIYGAYKRRYRELQSHLSENRRRRQSKSPSQKFGRNNSYNRSPNQKQYNNGYNYNRNNSYDRSRQRSRDRYQSSNNRNRSNSTSNNRYRSNSRDQKRRDSTPYNYKYREQRDRSRELRGRYPNYRPGYNTPKDYDPSKNKYCTKCSVQPQFDHHMHDCRDYDKYNYKACTNCKQGTHQDEECKTKRVSYATDLN